MTVPDSKLSPQLLAALHETVEAELLPLLKGARERELALCVTRVLARMRLEAGHRAELEAAFQPDWTALGKRLGCETAGDVATQSRRIGEVLRAGPSPSGQDVRAAVALMDRYHAAVEVRVPGVAPRTAEADDSAAVRLSLGRYLKQRFPALPDDPVVNLRIVPGGRAKQTALFELAPNAILPTRLVLRRDLGDSTTGTSVHAEFPLLQKLESIGLPIPSPVLAEADASKLGGSFVIVTEVRDAVRAGEFFAELNDVSVFHESFVTDLARAMAQLHGLTEHPSGDALGGHTAGVAPLDVVRNFQQLWTSLTHRPPMSATTDLGFAWLLAHPLPADRPRRLVHGDIGFHNLMRRDGRLAAILDWELTHLGDPAEDLAYPRIPMIESLTSWERFTAAYQEAGGLPEACDPQALTWYGVWAYTRNSVYTGLLHDWAMTGKRTDLEAFSVGWDFFDRMQGYLARQLTRAMESPA